ncbi:helix-turn-helix domain-containing protein [Crossiella cryophila]|uniref:DNA-binding CsgD family transcriptional regulator n=1 Tax=Crossiella cryophila TaxID=43355 RepID=A0A7W7CA25_9PSEU|nr:PucR family transcriptional regulator [Crossiella cryophila]MBB4677322.1 DNA-binding CsgD family transcriptional regulator [Crossiella cryophila]
MNQLRAGLDPWKVLSRDLAPLMRAEVPDVADQILGEIQRGIPEYSRPLDESFGQIISDGIEYALMQFVDRVADPGAPQPAIAEMYRRLGRGEFHEGRSLDTLQRAYRLGARIAWRRLTDFGERVHLSVDTMRLLGEAVFAHIDELAALSVEGYVAAQQRATGARERRRRRLLEVLLADPPNPRHLVIELAAAAEWELPDRVCAVALEPRPDRVNKGEPRLDRAILVDFEGSAPCLLIPAGAEHERLLDRPLQDWLVAVGPTVELSSAAESLRWARHALNLMRAGTLPALDVQHCADHLCTLWLLHEDFLLDELTARVLAPLAELTPRQRERLTETLLAWLETRSGAPEVAARLGIHPQTVRYRLHQLESLFGHTLTDPAARFELELVLRAARLRQSGTAGQPIQPGQSKPPVR